MTVYLCGPMEGVTLREAEEWRETATTFLLKRGIPVKDPTRRKRFHDQPPTTNLSRKIVAMDLQDIDSCEVILVNLKDRGVGKAWGSVAEVTYAWMKRKPIILVLEADYYHPFLDTFATERVETLEEALGAIEGYYV